MLARALSSFLPDRRSYTDFGPLSDFWYNPVGTSSSAGVWVKPDNAMAVAAAFACIRLLSEIMGALDLKIFAIDGAREVPAPDHYLWDVLYKRPNRWQTPMEWEEMGMAHLCLRGNFICHVIFNEEGRIELVPLNPDRVEIKQLANRTIQYIYQPKLGAKVIYSAAEIFHVRGMSLDGVTGVSVLEYAKNAVGLALAEETHGAGLFKGGLVPPIWISRPQGSKFGDEAKRNFRQGWRRLHGGAENSVNPPILQDGMEIHELGLSHRDAQWLESRTFQAVEICRFFRVPPHMIGITDPSPKANVEQMSIEFVRYTLGPWATRWCQSIDRDLIDEPEKYRAKVNLDDLQKASQSERYSANNVAIQGGWLTVNEVRASEGRDPIAGGDTPRYPTNMQPAGGGPDWNEQGGQPGKGSPKGKPAAVPTEEEEEAEPTKREKQRADDKKRRKQEKKKQKAQTAFGVLLDDAAARLAAAEIRGLERRAERAAEDPAKWRAFLNEFYAEHCVYACKVLHPIAMAWHRQTGLSIEVNPRANYPSVGELSAPGADVAAVLDGWRSTRASEISIALRSGLFLESTL
jgi:HK97 family phage portal protein